MAVIGAGYIAVELAGILNALSSKVSSLIRYDKVVNGIDFFMSSILFHMLLNILFQVSLPYCPIQAV